MPTLNQPLSAAGADLGLGDALSQQVEGETEEMRKKRIQELAQKQALGPAGSLSVTSLFGMNGGAGAAKY